MRTTINKQKIITFLEVLLLSAVFCLENVYLKDVWPEWIYVVLTVANVAVLIATVLFCLFDKEVIYKLGFSVYVIAVIVFGIFSLLKVTGVTWNFMRDGVISADAIKEYILSLGNLGLVMFLLLQIAQVTLIPIPSNVVTMVGVGVFGVWPAFLMSSIGQIIGSIIAFALGKIFGVKLVKWIVGAESMEKYQGMIKGRDKLMLTLMFLFPVFPDDILCLIAGISSMGWIYFIVVMCISRPLTCLGNAFLADGALNIPFEGWGIVAWIAIVLIVGSLFIAILKYGDKIQEFMLSKFKRIKSKDEK